MLDLSPTKLLIIFIVVVVLLGPKRLPEVARQLGAGWRKLRELHLQFDRELRQSLPDLPSSQDIVRFARSPVALLNQLADREDPPASPEGVAAGAAGGNGTTGGPRDGAGPAGASGHASTAPPPPADAFAVARPALDADDPNLN